jgi:peptidoglycan/xylan/chitin deacetylase (PgdA/CDA1 family)
LRAVPVFMYHHLNWHAGDLVTLTPDDFENHLRVLQDRKIQTVFLGDLVAWMERSKQLPQPSVALTFDDGHLDNWVFAFPLLRKYGMKATIFVITSWMGEGEKRSLWQPDGPDGDLPPILRHKEVKRRAADGDLSIALNWEEALAMEASGLVDIQSHTHFHRHYFLPRGRGVQLDPSKRDFLREDLVRSKELIEKRLRKKCRFLCWPWGEYDGEAQALALNLGFEGQVTTKKGVNYPGSDVMAIKRVVTKTGGEGWFSRRLTIYSQRTLGRVYGRISGIL